MTYDMILVHAPSVYDFRDRDDILFAYLSNSDSVHVSPIFEMPPVGILSLKQHLNRCGFSVEFFNVASQMLRDPEFDVEAFFQNTAADIIGIDLHWLAHAHGALELAALYKRLHPSAKTVVGGITSTYYHEELIAYPQIDYVVRGYDTLRPMEQLLKAGNAVDELLQVPNLTWKHDGEIHVNALSHVPRVYSAAVDWSQVFEGGRENMTPYSLVIPQAGCEYSCRWCGGSHYFYKNHLGIQTPIQKTPELLKAELESIAQANTRNHTVTMIDFWHEYPKLFDAATDVFRDESISKVHFSLTRLPKIEKGKRMSSPVKAIIELSPDSHDLKIGKASGRGHYSMEQMENFIDALLDDVYSFEIYFMIGLPEQTAASVWETVDYCEHVLKKYRGRRVTPYICPMLPFLDPGSEIFDHPDEWGYRIFHRTLQDHSDALLSMNWKNRINFETVWLSRDELVAISYEAVRALTLLKKKYGFLPGGVSEGIVSRIDGTTALLKEIDRVQSAPPGSLRAALDHKLRPQILAYNRDQFKRIRSQQRPVDFGFTNRQWFDTDEAFR